MRHLKSALLLGALALLAGCGTTEKPETSAAASPGTPTTDEEKALYALGAAFGQQACRPLRLTDSEIAILQAGLAAGARGEKPQFELSAYQEQLQKLAEGRAELAAAEESEKSRAFREEAAAADGAVKTDSGLVYKTMTSGQGETPGPDSTVRVHYRGTLTDGTEFDSSIKRGQPVEFRVGQVIPCWQEALQRMKVGEKAHIVCPAEIAYGNQGSAPAIPPGATLVFEVELLGIK